MLAPITLSPVMILCTYLAIPMGTRPLTTRHSGLGWSVCFKDKRQIYLSVRYPSQQSGWMLWTSPCPCTQLCKYTGTIQQPENKITYFIYCTFNSTALNDINLFSFCAVMWLNVSTFQRKVLPPVSGSVSMFKWLLKCCSVAKRVSDI